MSLIHDALKESGTVATPARPAVRGSWWTQRRLLSVAALALMVVPVLLLAGLRHLRGDAPPTATAVAPAAIAPPPASAEPAPPAVASSAEATPSAPLAEPPPPQPAAADTAASGLAAAVAAQAEAPRLATAQPDATPLPASPNAEHASGETATGPAASPDARIAAAAPANTEATQQPISIKVERRTATGKATEADDEGAVDQAVGSIEAAMAAGDLPAAHQALAGLEALLPAESLTLLRMHAWLAHADNDGTAAERLYRRIAERVPGDINAGVNIALLEARRGELDDARQRLAQLSSRYPRSPQVARALAELEATPR